MGYKWLGRNGLHGNFHISIHTKGISVVLLYIIGPRYFLNKDKKKNNHLFMNCRYIIH